jgi:flagellar basal body-associated protein FliL
VTDKDSAEPGGTEKPLPAAKRKEILVIAGLAILVILVAVAAVSFLFPANPGSSGPGPSPPEATPAETVSAVTPVTTERTIPPLETPFPTQPVDFVLVPSDQVNCGLTCRQLDATITNTGYETAHAVCITLTIHNSRDEIISLNGDPSLQQCVGDIGAGASKTEPITINADCGPFATRCIGETLTLETTVVSEEKTVRFPDQQVAV